MTSDLLNQFKDFISPNLLSALNRRYDENEKLLRKTIEVAICAVLIGLNDKIDDGDLYDEMVECVSKSEFFAGFKFNESKQLTIYDSFQDEGHDPLNLLFAAKKNRVSEMISNEICVKSGTASAVLDLSVMMVMSYFIKKGQNVFELSSILETEIHVISKRIPKGLKILLGISTNEYVEDDSSSKGSSSIYNFFFNRLASKV